MAATSRNPCTQVVLAAEVSALDMELSERSRAWIGGERIEAACALVRAARELVGDSREPLDRDVLRLLRVTGVCCAPASTADVLETADVAAALTLIAKTVTVASGDTRTPHDGGLGHVRTTLAEIAGTSPHPRRMR